ncbi:MAG: hypothetical protein MPN21_10315 [Thermoanaerobaculia bacterium]|nr:hypothetical protein [Thermoanaerobaculia bacterium]
MRVVNLSQRPFLNRRPVERVAVLLWIFGVLLLALNVWLYAGYLSGTFKNRERLAELNSEIDAAEQEFEEVGQRLGRVALGERNLRAVFLNDLIDQRTFPWSRLFDDLEDALHDDVYLSLVAPKVEIEEKPTSRPRTASRRITPRAAREQARRQQSGNTSSLPTPESTNVEEESEFDVVTLELQGTARTDDALLEFVDALYQNPSFVDPFLSSEHRNEKTRGIDFAITSFYLLPRRAEAQPDSGVVDSDSEDATAEPILVVEDGSLSTVTENGDGETEDDVAYEEPEISAAETGGGRGDLEVSTENSGVAASEERIDHGEVVQAPSETQIERNPESRGTPRDAESDGRRGRPGPGPRGTVRPPRGPSERTDPHRPDDRRNRPVSPELTEPPASASPALRRLSSWNTGSPPRDVGATAGTTNEEARS